MNPPVRTFSLVKTPNWADPDGENPFIEFDASQHVEGVVPPLKLWGWRGKIVAALIRFLLPEPPIYRGRS